MNIQELRPQFSIFVFLPEVALTTELKQAFASSGYETFMFIDQDMLIDRVKEAAPHVIVFSPDALMTGLSEFTQAILGINSEVQMICVSPIEQTPAIYEYRDYNFAQLVQPGEFLHLRALWAVDSVCERLALQYQNESIVDRMNELQQLEEMNRNELQEMQLSSQSHQKQVEDSPRVMNLVEKFSRAQSKEEFVDTYLRHVADRKPGVSFSAVYFKYLPSVVSFIATQGHQINLERTKGIGLKLVGEESKDIAKDLQQHKLPTGFRHLLQDAFQIKEWVIYPLFLKGQVEGVVVFWGLEMNQGDWEEFLLFQLCYQNIQLQKRVEALEIQEPITELFTKDFFQKRMDEEVSRSRRLLKPVSLVILSLDKYNELGEKIGATQRDLILRSISLLIKKTSRVNDFACRTGESEISLILPHCSRKGASIRSERLRKAIESHSFAMNGVQVTVSSGVSEYPSLCATAEDLSITAGEALAFITTRGGNKVCLYKPSDDFKPDFDVPAV